MTNISDVEILARLRDIASTATEETLGDVYVEACPLAFLVQSPINRQYAQYYLSHLEQLAKEATIGWSLFISPELPKGVLNDNQIIRLIVIVATLQTFIEGVEALDAVSFLTGPSSRKVTFFVNSVYHFIAALYLLNRDGDPMGGMVYKALEAIGLTQLLGPIKEILDREYAEGVSFGETVRTVRNKSLVHGTFSPEDIASLVKQTKMRNPSQLIRLADLIWELHHQSAVLMLKLIAILTKANPPLDQIFEKVIAELD